MPVKENDSKKSAKAKVLAEKSKPSLASDYELVIGDCVVSSQYGRGFITDVIYDKNFMRGQKGRFCVEFDSGEEKTFAFPVAFDKGMYIEVKE